MNSKRKYTLVAAIIVAFAVAAPAITQASGFAVIPPNDAHAQAGQNYGTWSVNWWQYVLSQPAPNNPLKDLTGQDCAVDQLPHSRVFFLVGTFGSGSATRNNCTVPAGKFLFLPLVNFIDIHVPEGLPGGDTNDTVPKLWADLQSFIRTVTELHASIDGVPVSNLVPAMFRTCAGLIPPCTAPGFSVTLPDNNLFGVSAGVYSPVVTDGYYLMLAPLPPGPHTIKFGGAGTFNGTPFSEDITYNLIVSPR
ncbi:hypothetical protein [Paraburkholderia hospita]|uniref:hypothetical protein n=1 Tax=Paraburkholderia hospita TaxID=169430 RepID=UPI00027158FC|nr:hypothetical protein [Paraburkholderia hospita]EUC18437.1 hypothetical protein PMI06_003343 [Burkholderia sp. BT03]SKC77091.1 hypothetical protein SAMN06266956_3020 [Paraburkholderia hospita]